MSEENNLRRLPSDWIYVDRETRSRYLLQNLNKADCSFLVKHPNNENSQKILESFRWILKDVSPYFEQILNADANCKKIPIDDPYFEDFLVYVHTEVLPGRPKTIEQLLEMQERAEIYEIPNLIHAIGKRLSSLIHQVYIMGNKWINLFEIAYDKKPKTRTYAYILRCALETVRGDNLEEVIEMSMNTIVKFDVDLFISFIAYIAKQSLDERYVLQTIETYLENNASFEETIKKTNIAKSAFISILFINENQEYNLQDFEDYPKISELFK